MFAVKAVEDPVARLDCPTTVRTPEAERLVVEALARVVCPVTVRAVADAVAKVDCPVTTNAPVVVLLVMRALLKVAKVAKRLDEVALVNTEEEAKMLEVKVLRKRSVEEPREKVVSADGVMLPATWRRSVGAATPIPTLPLAKILKTDTPEEEATLKVGRVSPALPTRLTSDEVDVVPTRSAESHPDPMTIAVSVAEPPVIEPMLRAFVVPVAVPDPANGMLIPLNTPPAA